MSQEFLEYLDQKDYKFISVKNALIHFFDSARLLPLMEKIDFKKDFKALITINDFLKEDSKELDVTERRWIQFMRDLLESVSSGNIKAIDFRENSPLENKIQVLSYFKWLQRNKKKVGQNLHWSGEIIEEILNEIDKTIERIDQSQKERSNLENIFKKSGELWTVGIEGEETIENLISVDGMHYIAHLLKNPYEDIAVEDLFYSLKGYPSSGIGTTDPSQFNPKDFADTGIELKSHLGSQQKIRSFKNKDFLSKHKEELERELEKIIRAGGDQMKEGEIGAEIIKIANELNKFKSKGNLMECFPTTRDNMRGTVTKGVKNAIDKIRKNGGNILATHLEKNIKKGFLSSYRPNPDEKIEWILN